MSWVDWLEQHMLPCPTKYFFGMDCPGCGMQRSLVELLNGNFLESLKLYPGLLPMLFTLVFLVLHLIFKFERGAKVLQYSYIFSAVIVVGAFVVKQLNHTHV